MTLSAHWVVIRVTMVIAAIVLSPGLVHQCLAQTGIPELPDPGTTRISREQQQQLGLQAGAEVYKQIPVLPDSSPETQYVRQVGQRLVATIPREHSWPFEFHVIAQKEINAFALPGGEMFVNVGTIIAAANEAQLAGVMAHEMSHVYMQHSAKQMEKAQLTQGLVGLAGAILGNKGGALGSLAQAGVQVGAGMVMLKYSRSDEAQADEVGAVILYRARYNPQAMVDFFKTLESQGGSSPQFLSDHPNPGNREAAIRRETQGWPVKNYYGNEFRIYGSAPACLRRQDLYSGRNCPRREDRPVGCPEQAKRCRPHTACRISLRQDNSCKIRQRNREHGFFEYCDAQFQTFDR